MSYKVIAHGPVVGGRMTIPYRVVLLSWLDKDSPDKGVDTAYKCSTHIQTFAGAGTITAEAYLTTGEYYSANNLTGLKDAYRDFADRLSYDANNYGQNVVLDLDVTKYEGHNGR